jgi:hypothetical protein
VTGKLGIASSPIIGELPHLFQEGSIDLHRMRPIHGRSRRGGHRGADPARLRQPQGRTAWLDRQALQLDALAVEHRPWPRDLPTTAAIDRADVRSHQTQPPPHPLAPTRPRRRCARSTNAVPIHAARPQPPTHNGARRQAPPALRDSLRPEGAASPALARARKLSFPDTGSYARPTGRCPRKCERRARRPARHPTSVSPRARRTALGAASA